MKIILYLDTSVHGFGLALRSMEADQKIIYKFYNSDRSCANLKLSSLVKEALNEVALTTEDISAVVVSKGPGSFTGIRVGLAWVQGFCEGGQYKKIGVSSLECLAEFLLEKYGLDSLHVLLANTKKTGFLASCIDKNKTTLKFLSESCDKKKLEERVSHLFVDKAYEGLDKTNAMEVYNKEDFALLCFEAMLHKIGVDEVKGVVENNSLEPLYLRKSSVEEKLS